MFDRNGDGRITQKELNDSLENIEGRTFEDCKRMIMKVDVDGDGMVDYREFKKMMKGGGFSAVVNHMLGSPLIFITGCKYFGHQETAGIITQDQLRQVFMLAIG
ncbi:hypothetical protein NC651_018869 [Populus alba x Populus x berolinensis]|nr:hypothetical protein NC651_018869 [Populus alba x Populus x berolinensis]